MALVGDLRDGNNHIHVDTNEVELEQLLNDHPFPASPVHRANVWLHGGHQGSYEIESLFVFSRPWAQQQSYVYPKPNLHQCQVLLVSIDRVIRVGADNVLSDRRTHNAYQMESTRVDPLTVGVESFIVANIL